MKIKAIKKQKKIISDLKCFSSEKAINDEIDKLNLLVDDFEKNDLLIDKDNIYLYVDFLEKEDLKQIIIQFENEYSKIIDEDIMDIIDILENRLQNI